MEDYFLTQVMREMTREGAPLELMLINREGLKADVMFGDCFKYSDHKMIEFSVLGEAWMAVSRTAAMNFHRVDFILFKDLVNSSLGRDL